MNVVAVENLEVEWPSDEGIWMGWIETTSGDWFPLKTMALRDDLPRGGETLANSQRRLLAIVAQWPESEKSWPYTFKGCHPVKRWRRPTEDELRRAKIFYGITEK
jgi:hypothetical protein